MASGHNHHCWSIKMETSGSLEVPHPVNKVPRAFIIHMRLWWAYGQDVARLQAKTVSNNFIWSESTQWLRSSSIHKIPGALITPMGTPIMPPMGKWTWCCTSTGYDGSNELDFKIIIPVVTESQHPQDFSSLYHTNGHTHYAHRDK